MRLIPQDEDEDLYEVSSRRPILLSFPNGPPKAWEQRRLNVAPQLQCSQEGASCIWDAKKQPESSCLGMAQVGILSLFLWLKTKTSHTHSRFSLSGFFRGLSARTAIHWLPQEMILMRICLCIVSDSSYSHPYTLPITCTCCYDLSKGTQDKDFSYSFFDSLSGFCFSLTSDEYSSSSMLLYTLTITLSSLLCIILVVMMRSTEFKTSRSILMLIL